MYCKGVVRLPNLPSHTCDFRRHTQFPSGWYKLTDQSFAFLAQIRRHLTHAISRTLFMPLSGGLMKKFLVTT